MIAHAASFRVLNSARDKMSIKTGKTLASMTAWICWRLPAVTLEIVQQASLRMLSVKIKVGLISNLVKSKTLVDCSGNPARNYEYFNFCFPGKNRIILPTENPEKFKV